MKFPRAAMRLALDPYPVTLHLYTSRATYCRVANDNRSRERLTPKERCAGLCTEFGEDVMVGVFDRDPVTLVHELAHAVEHVADHVGLTRGFPNEPVAYLLERMYRECIPFITTERAAT
jgi:hypothetical protein